MICLQEQEHEIFICTNTTKKNLVLKQNIMSLVVVGIAYNTVGASVFDMYMY